jgi:hypothetical protein
MNTSGNTKLQIKLRIEKDIPKPRGIFLAQTVSTHLFPRKCSRHKAHLR